MAGSRFDQITLLITLLVALWVSSQFGQLEGQTDTTSVSTTYTFMALIALVVSFAGMGIFQFIGIKSSGTKILLIGGIIGFLSTSQGKTAIAPLLPAAIDPTLSGVFILFLAPFVEEYFFRGFLFPTLVALSGNKGISSVATGAVVSSAIFVIWHLVAYISDPSQFLPLFIFSIVQCSLVHFTKELTPAIGSHFIMNLLTMR